MSPGFSAFRSNEGASGAGASTFSSGPSTSSVRAVEVALAGTAAGGGWATTAGPRAGARAAGAIVGPGAGNGVIDGAGVENVCDDPNRPVIEVRPSSFCIALLTARMTV